MEDMGKRAIMKRISVKTFQFLHGSMYFPSIRNISLERTEISGMAVALLFHVLEQRAPLLCRM